MWQFSVVNRPFGTFRHRVFVRIHSSKPHFRVAVFFSSYALARFAFHTFIFHICVTYRFVMTNCFNTHLAISVASNVCSTELCRNPFVLGWLVEFLPFFFLLLSLFPWLTFFGLAKKLTKYRIQNNTKRILQHNSWNVKLNQLYTSIKCNWNNSGMNSRVVVVSTIKIQNIGYSVANLSININYRFYSLYSLCVFWCEFEKREKKAHQTIQSPLTRSMALNTSNDTFIQWIIYQCARQQRKTAIPFKQ